MALAAVVDDNWLKNLRAISDARRDAVSARQHEDHARLCEGGATREQLWTAVGVVTSKHSADSYGERIADARGRLTPEAAALLDADLAHLDPVALMRAFPRDKLGLVLDETVRLAPYATSEATKRGKTMWLVARSPQRRSQPQHVALLLDVIDGDNHPLTWERARHRWDVRGARPSEAALLGMAGLPLPLLDAEDRDARIDQLLAASPERAESKAAASILLLDAGRFADAFALYGVGLARSLVEALQGAPVSAFRELIVEGHGESPMWDEAAARDAARLGPKWIPKLRHELHRAAPWLLPEAVKADPATKRRAARARRGRLFTLSYGSAARRPAVFLDALADGAHQLGIDFSGTNSYLPDDVWARPIELELLRFGVSAAP
jgi:hypothetical protein